MSGYLELADGSIVGVRDGLVLGRVAACDVVVDDKKASRRHARLISGIGSVILRWLTSLRILSKWEHYPMMKWLMPMKNLFLQSN